jgi:hypothetical protein
MTPTPCKIQILGKCTLICRSCFSALLHATGTQHPCPTVTLCLHLRSTVILLVRTGKVDRLTLRRPLFGEVNHLRRLRGRATTVALRNLGSRAQRAPACTTLCAVTSLVTAAWRKVECWARDLHPARTCWALGGQRVDR